MATPDDIALGNQVNSMAGYFTWTLIVLVLFCYHINSYHQDGNSDAKIPGQLLQRAKCLRKSLKACEHPRQVETLFALALLLSGDIHLNPGPRTNAVFPCGQCDCPVRNINNGVECNKCNVWNHRSCISDICTSLSESQLRNVHWICHKCDSINCDSFTFRSFASETSFYSPLSDLDDTVDSLDSRHVFSPMKFSSPNQPRTPPSPNNPKQ